MGFEDIARTIAQGLYGEKWREAESQRLGNERARQVMDLATRGDEREARRLGLAEEAGQRASALHESQVRLAEGAMTDAEKAAESMKRHNEEMNLRREIAAANAARDTATAARLEAQLEETRRRNAVYEKQAEAAEADRAARATDRQEASTLREARQRFDVASKTLQNQRQMGELSEEEFQRQSQRLYEEFVAAVEGREIEPYEEPPEKEGFLGALWRSLTSPNIADPYGAPRPGDDLRR